MDSERIKELLKKQQLDQLTEQERAVLDTWYLKLSQTEKIDVDHNDMSNRLDMAWDEIEVNKKLKRRSNQLRLIRVSSAVAAAVAVITLGVWLYYGSGLFGNSNPDLSLSSQVTRDLNDIGPGSNKAILTLANGKTIELSDVKTGVVIGNDLTYNDGSKVANLSPGGREDVVQMLTARTPRGGTYQVTLPDGTRVWLNADSKISFPSQFSGKQRKISLSGEAYFEVTKNKRMPFIVESEGQQVEVLGTHFNINSYAEEGATKTTLLEGSVRVASLASRQIVTRKSNIVTLLPNHQSILTNKNINVTPVDSESEIAWKNGKFVFNSESMASIMRKVARWYDVEIVYKDNVQDQTFTGSVNRFDNVSKLLRKVEMTNTVHFKIEGRRIIVTR